MGMATLIILCAFFLNRWKKTYTIPHLFYSNLNDLKIAEHSTKNRFYFNHLSKYLYYLALLSFLLAFIDPHFLISKRATSSHIMPKGGIAIYLVIDQSGSMNNSVNAASTEEMSTLSKEDFVKQVTTQFITGNPDINLAGRPNDLIGLVSFARTAQILSPLTLNHTFLVDQLSKIHVVTTQENDGTAIGYAIF